MEQSWLLVVIRPDRHLVQDQQRTANFENGSDDRPKQGESSLSLSRRALLKGTALLSLGGGALGGLTNSVGARIAGPWCQAAKFSPLGTTNNVSWGSCETSTQIGSLLTIADDGPQMAIHSTHNPQAVYVESERTTIITWRGPNANPLATAYDHDDETMAQRTKIGETSLPPDDNHGPPAICIDDDGYIIGAYGGHNDIAPQLFRSANPYDTSAWVDLGTTQDNGLPGGTYPSFACYQGDIYFVMRAGNGHGAGNYPRHQQGTICRSTDRGDSWADLGPVIDINDHPDAPGVDAYPSDLDVLPDGRLHVSWAISEGGGHHVRQRGAYHAVFDPENNTMNALRGATFATPLRWNIIRDSPYEAYFGIEGGVPKHAGRPDGTVYLSHRTHNAERGVIERRIHTWNPGADDWQSEVVPGAEAMGIKNIDAPRIADDGTLELYAITQETTGDVHLTSTTPRRKGGEFKRFRRVDGQWVEDVLASREQVDHGWQPLEVIKNGPDALPALVSEWMADSLETGSRFAVWGPGL